jgi:hypothetical protein
MFPIHFRSRLLFFLSCGLLAALWGCGSPTKTLKDRASAAGTVTFDGKALPAGTIGFESADGQISTAVSVKSDGTFFTDRAPIGKSLVTVDTTSIQAGNRAAYVPIPEKYNNSRTSGLTADIQPGENQKIDFALRK